MITDEQAAEILEDLKRETYTAIPSQLSTDKVRTQALHGYPAIRHTPRRRSLAEMDRERND